MILNAPAKINFGLWIGRRRSDGFHPVSTVYIPIRLFDTVMVELNESGSVDLSCDDETLPAGMENLCWKAADLFFQETGIRAGASIRLKKRIPSGAGLGGGSSDAAAVLMALNRLLFGEMADERLLSIAARIGADVPFFLYRRPCAARGIGEILTPVEIPDSITALVVVPRFPINTAGAYKAFDDAAYDAGPEIDFSPMLKKLIKSPENVRKSVYNDFEPVLFPIYPKLQEIKNRIYAENPLYASLSGSGSAVYGLFKSDKTAQNAAKSFSGAFRIFTARLICSQTDETFTVS